MAEPRKKTSRRALIGAVFIVAVVLGIASTQTCLRTGFAYGLWLDHCPDGDVKQTLRVDAYSLSRGAKGTVSLAALANYTFGPADERRSEANPDFTPSLSLVGPDGEQALTPKKGWTRSGDNREAEIELPKVSDGDYTLRAKASSRLGDTVLDVPLPLYAPATVHVLTDRPLYEPGNTVKFRAVVLKGADLTPLDDRPGTWRVSDPNGEVLLEEKAPAGAWGVVAGSFPLDSGAESGIWTVTWTSGPAVGARSFDVRPFTLPRFRVEANTAKTFYRRGERPVLRGTVRYASGAPVAKAKVEASWSVSGDWPAPTSWTDGSSLPKVSTADASGAFTFELPAVPEDLQKQAHLSARLSAIDPSGDRVEGSADVLLSEDPIAVTAITELQSGLVEGFNNRVFLRATTADGQVLRNVTLNVKRLWEPTDKGTDAEVDEDGVAQLQLDPGPPVNVVIPAMPFRPPPRAKMVTRQSLANLLAGEEDDGDVRLADRLAFDRIEARLEQCTRYAVGGTNALAGVQVTSSGAVQAVSVPKGRLGDCMSGALASLRFEAGRARVFSASWYFNDEDLPRLEMEVDGVPHVPAMIEDALRDALLDTRDCLPAAVSSGSLPLLATWRFTPAWQVELTWAADPEGGRLAEGPLRCIQSRLSRVQVERPRGVDAVDIEEEEITSKGVVGTAHFDVVAPEKYESVRPQPTVMTGYEFLVSARAGKESLGRTKLFVQPGAIPNIRLRASKQIVAPGEKVTVEILRGPDFTGELPKKLYLTHAHRSVESEVNEEKRTADFTIPSDVEGWAEVSWSEGRVVFFVQPPSRLAVTVKPEKERYTPGQVANLQVETSIGNVGKPAAVGLFGVDDSLSQLVALPGSDELASLRPSVSASGGFGGLDAQALSLGRVRGQNAAQATLLTVSSLPPPPTLEAAVDAHGSTVFDPNEALVDRFYVVLGELYTQVREWESTAPKNAKLQPQTLADLWRKSITQVERRGESARDAWGRPLRLHRLPMDLLSLTEPRAVVVDATRLPEDLQNWSKWVAKEKP